MGLLSEGGFDTKMSLWRTRVAYGLDLGGGRAVVVRVGARRADPGEIVWDGLAEGPEWAAFAARATAEVAAGRATTAAAVRAHEAVVRWVAAPFSSVRKARKVFASLLDIQLPFPLESCAYEFLDVRRAGTETRALAVAARREHVNAHLEKLRGLGWDPVVLDAEALALWTQSVQELPIETQAVRVVAYLGEEHSVLVEGEGLAWRAAHAWRKGRRDVGGDAEAAEWAERARRVLRWPLGGGDLSATRGGGAAGTRQWVWTGPGSADATCRQRLERALALGSEVVFLEHREPHAFLARALAGRARRAGPLRCNLRSGDLAHPEAVRAAWAAERRLAWAYVGLGLLLGAQGWTWTAELRRREARAQAALTQLAQELTGSARVPRGQEVFVARRAWEQRRSQEAAFAEALSPSLTATLATVLDAARAAGVQCESLSLKRGSLQIVGSGSSWEVGERLAEALRRTGFEVDLKTEEALAEERVRFTLRALAESW